MQLIAEKRTEFGKKLKNLRYGHRIPGVIFGKDVESFPVSVDKTNFVKVFKKSGETSLVDLKVGDEVSKVLIKEVQYHPVTSQVLHVNFHKVNLREKIEANIPLEIIGDEENPLLKSGEAILLQILNEITIEALPANLPDKFEVDVSGLKEIGDSITIEDLQYDNSKIELAEYDEGTVIAKLDYPMQEETAQDILDEQAAIEALEATEEAKEVDAADKETEASEE